MTKQKRDSAPGVHSHFSVVMYHYVRDLKNSRYPEIKGLDLPLFIEQIEFLRKNYHVLRIDEVFAALERRVVLPRNSILLTFDDNYIDHYLHAFPILAERGLQGCFFSPVRAITEHKVLDVNKIHFILASQPDKKALVRLVFAELDRHRKEHELKSNEELYEGIVGSISRRFDPPDVVFIKGLLQQNLPQGLRAKITDDLFQKTVGMSEAAFSRELYMNEGQIRCMIRAGMHFGGHGFDHHCLNALPYAAQEAEIDKSAEFLRSVGADADGLTFCYPYGEFNEDTVAILRARGFQAAFTSVVDAVDLEKYTSLTIPRLDANDLPQDRRAKPNRWFPRN